MIANGVPVSFDIALLFTLGGIVLGGYAAIWSLPRIVSLFR